MRLCLKPTKVNRNILIDFSKLWTTLSDVYFHLELDSCKKFRFLGKVSNLKPKGKEIPPQDN